jgi:hypothetical protein
MEMHCKIGTVSVLIGDKVGWVAFLLAQPAIPEVLDALLVSRRADYPQGMKVNCSLNDVGGGAFFAVLEDRVTLEEDMNEKMILIFLGFDNSLRYDLTSCSSKLMEFGIPQLLLCLALKPSQRHE